MRKHLLIVIALLAWVASSVAQENSRELKRVEVFTGYQFVHVYPAENGSGWNFSLTGNLTRSFGFTGDFSGAYEHGSQLYTYMAGPTFSARTKHVTPFVHALFGGGHADGANAFAMALGGGVDVNAGQHLALRLIQADWMSFRRGGESINSNVRASMGLVFRF
jgi:hypothetical protein